MTTTLKQLNHYNPLGTTWIFALAVLILLPALLFSSVMPAWTPIAALLGLAFLFLLRSIAIGRFTGHTPVDGPLFLLLIMLWVGLWVTTERSITLPRTYAFIANLALFWAIASQRDTPWLRWSGWGLLLGSLALGTIFLFGTRFSPSSKLPFIGQEIYKLLPGESFPLFWNPGSFNTALSGGLLALFWSPAVVLIWLGNSWQQRDFAKLVALFLTILILLTQSRGALLGIIVALPFITLFHNRRWWPVWGLILAIGIIGSYHFGADNVQKTMLGEKGSLNNPSLQRRQEIWKEGVLLIRDYPLTGVGLGMVEASATLDPDDKHVHNIFLQAGAEMGVPGLIAHLAFYLILFYLLVQRVLDHQAGYYRALALGLLGSLVTFLTHGLFDAITYFDRTAFVIWGLFGLMAAVATTTANRSGNTRPC